MARKKNFKNRLKLALIFVCLALLIALLSALFTLSRETDKVQETDETTYGIDVAKYQGTIDWAAAAGEVDFVMVRLGYRTQDTGLIVADSNAAYNLQQARDQGIPMGAYFFSTAVTEEEALEEANWVADFLDPYPITYPVAFNCENFEDPDSRQYRLSRWDRTDLALVFLKQIEKRGYEAMFYASKNEMTDDAKWMVSQIDPEYKIWVAQYPEAPYPETPASTYSGVHHMWQYTREGQVAGVSQFVDRDVAYFGYTGIRAPKSEEAPAPAQPDPEALMEFRPMNQQVTAKDTTNLRSIPSQGEDAEILATLQRGQIATRIGVSDSGWSKVEFEGRTYYAVSSLLTTDLDGETEETQPDPDGIQTQFQPVSQKVTAKELVNLRNIPSTQREDSNVVVQLKHGDVALRTGINEDVGWSRVEYLGQVLYCVSSYLEAVE